jgi:CRISPR-associated exonuclease Cas4
MVSEILSASELERFSYCPLSWWLSRSQDTTSERLEEGERRHGDLSNNLKQVIDTEKRVMVWERAVLWFSLIATILALVAILIINEALAQESLWLSTIPSVLWISLILYMVYRSGRGENAKHLRKERMAAVAGVVLLFLVLNLIIIFDVPTQLSNVMLILALIWLIGSGVVLYWSLSEQRKAEIKRKEMHLSGNVLYVGNDEAPIYRSERYGLSGKPDYVLQEGEELVPVEMKSGRTPKGPLFSHIVQVAAYCLLLEDYTGKRVTRGVLKYTEAEYDVDFDENLRQLVLTKIDEMHHTLEEGEAHRNHNRPGKCQSCSRREGCPERLV